MIDIMHKEKVGKASIRALAAAVGILALSSAGINSNVCCA